MTAPLRVMILRDHVVWSGGTSHFAELLPRLDPRRISVQFLVLANPGPERDIFEALGVTPHFLPRRRVDPFGFRGVLRRIRAARPHLLHLSGPRAMLVGRAAGLLTRTPSVVWFNNALPEPGWQRGLQRHLATATTGAIAVSRATADWAARSYALPRASIDVQYSTPELSAFLAVDESHGRLVREAFGIPDQARVIVLAGRVVDAQKGHFGMVRTMPEILSRVPSAHLLIVGEGRDLPQVGNLVAELGLRAQVTLAGMRRDMPNVLAAADVAVVPSLVEEAFPYAAIEASAVGLPVVAFRSGGLPEAVRDNGTGLIVATNDWTGLGTALCRCLSEPALARALGAAGRDLARSFSKAEEARLFTEYHETIAGRAVWEIKADGSP